MVGIVLVAVFNPFSIVLLADAAVIVIEAGKVVLVDVSMYAVAVGATLLGVGGLFKYLGREEKQTVKLKKMKHKPTQKAGRFLDIKVWLLE